jgi:imidazolonepropionase-like amidohydrolase
MKNAWLPPVLAAWLLVPSLALAQSSLSPPPGIRENTPQVQAFINARIVIAPGRLIERGTLVVRKGVIEAVGAGLKAPADAQVIDLAGYTLYAGFLDAAVEMGPGPSGAGPARGGNGEDGPAGPAAPPPPRITQGANYWSRYVTPELAIERALGPDSLAGVTSRRLRSQGVTDIVALPSKGVIKGTGAVLALSEDGFGGAIVQPHAALEISFESPVPPGVEEYPGSRMGAYTLARQAFYDADWQRRALIAAKGLSGVTVEPSAALDALQGWATGTAPVVIDSHDELDALRADRFGKEFSLPVVIRGSGREYKRLDDIKATGRAVIVPVLFPRPPIVDTPEQSVNNSLEQLEHWDLAPENAGRLAKAGVKIALTSDRIEDKREFLAGVRKAVERGLTPDAALAALTTTPAALFGVSNRLGTLEAGKLAHLLVTDGDVFDRHTKVREVWIGGRRYDVRPRPAFDARGTWDLALSQPAGTSGLTLSLDGLADSLGGSVTVGGPGVINRPGSLLMRRMIESKLKRAEFLERRLFLSAPADSLTPGQKGALRLSATVEGDAMQGEGSWPDGSAFTFTARRTAPYVAPPDTARSTTPPRTPYPMTYPMGEAGWSTPPAQPAAVAFTHAIVWTSGPQGNLEDATVVVKAGKIAAVGRNVSVPAGAIVVDAKGEHLTAGLIDCHSHTATDGGVNEAGQTISAEVRIGDFIDANDINIYRELAGGLTEAHVLHGSANAIGGQCQLIKLRWGLSPEAMKFEGWKPTIKFALGENVKQANWGERFVNRYPQTRMGVEQLIRDEFEAGREYKQTWARGKDARGLPPRRDLELDAIADVLDGKRTIHCHSYRQDEILMLMHLCDEFKVPMGTFQHILEGYKVADEMAKRHIGGSTFSDWWAYKSEVVDAIPYNGAIMHDVGVVVSYNSDSNELARRLNSEAGKAVKYGGVSETEALKFVTINPAIQLKVENKVGSIEVGKDADLALWSGPPLSPRSRCEQTWIDGRKYFDRALDQKQRADEARLRAAIEQRALLESDPGGPSMGSGRRGPREDVYDGHDVASDDDDTRGVCADERGGR